MISVRAGGHISTLARIRAGTASVNIEICRYANTQLNIVSVLSVQGQ